MVIGLVLIVLSLTAAYYVRKTDLEEVLVEKDPYGRVYLYIGILLLFVVGVLSIIDTIP